METERKRYQIRYRGDYILVVDMQEFKTIERFYDWDGGWPAAKELLDRLNNGD